jgi:hypothetical protein
MHETTRRVQREILRITSGDLNAAEELVQRRAALDLNDAEMNMTVRTEGYNMTRPNHSFLV